VWDMFPAMRLIQLLACAPREPAAYAALGAAWKREWLEFLEPMALRVPARGR